MKVTVVYLTGLKTVHEIPAYKGSRIVDIIGPLDSPKVVMIGPESGPVVNIEVHRLCSGDKVANDLFYIGNLTYDVQSCIVDTGRIVGVDLYFERRIIEC